MTTFPFESHVLTPEEVEKLVLLAMYTSQTIDGRAETPEDELRAIVEWAESVRIHNGLLENVAEP